MSLMGPDNRHWVSPSGSVAAEGTKSYKLGAGQVGLFTRKSASALADAKGLVKTERLVLRRGLHPEEKFSGPAESEKNPSTVPFSLNTVKKVTVGYPKVSKQEVDSYRVGWDGIKDSTSFEFFKGDSWEMKLIFSGTPLSMFNHDAQFELNVPVVTDNHKFGPCDPLTDTCVPMTCQEETINIVNFIKNSEFPTGQKISKYFDVYPIFSTPTVATSTTEYTQYCLEYCGFGDDNEVAKVSAQYPGIEIKRDTLTNKFVMLIPTSEGAPSDYTIEMDSIMKGCEDCPTGYSEIVGGEIYAIKVEDDGNDVGTSVVETIAGAKTGSAKKTGQDAGFGYYMVATSEKLDASDIKAFITANPTAKVVYVGQTESICKPNATKTASWEACGTCNVSESAYRILIANDCNGSRLSDLEKRYPNFVIRQLENKNCLGIYEAMVPTGFSCDEGCNDAIIQQVFEATTPEPFDVNSHWYPVEAPAAQSGVACGFEIKAKPFIVDPSECLSDSVPFMATSMRIKSISGGYPLDLSLTSRRTKSVNVQQLTSAVDLDNLGGNLKTFERMGNYYFLGEPYSSDPNERFFRGNRSKLENLKQYADVALTVHSISPEYMLGASPKAMTYHVLVPVGRTAELEKLFKSIASEAGAEISYF